MLAQFVEEKHDENRVCKQLFDLGRSNIAKNKWEEYGHDMLREQEEKGH